jgi:hypothetical protein
MWLAALSNPSFDTENMSTFEKFKENYIFERKPGASKKSAQEIEREMLGVIEQYEKQKASK